MTSIGKPPVETVKILQELECGIGCGVNSFFGQLDPDLSPISTTLGQWWNSLLWSATTNMTRGFEWQNGDEFEGWGWKGRREREREIIRRAAPRTTKSNAKRQGRGGRGRLLHEGKRGGVTLREGRGNSCGHRYSEWPVRCSRRFVQTYVDIREMRKAKRWEIWWEKKKKGDEIKGGLFTSVHCYQWWGRGRSRVQERKLFSQLGQCN